MCRKCAHEGYLFLMEKSEFVKEHMVITDCLGIDKVILIGPDSDM